MSATEVVVVLSGLGLGFWLVSFLMSTSRSAPRPPRPAADASSPEPQSQQADAKPLAAWHEVLELHQHATPDQIREAYQRLMSQYHPDKVASLGAELRALAEKKSKEINAAYRDALQANDAGA